MTSDRRKKKWMDREEITIHGIFGLMMLALILVVFISIAGCGGSSGNNETTATIYEPHYPIMTRPQMWIVTTNDDLTAQIHTWEICGGSVSCSIAPSVFYAAGTLSTSQCYQQHGIFESVTATSDQQPAQCTPYGAN